MHANAALVVEVDRRTTAATLPDDYGSLGLVPEVLSPVELNREQGIEHRALTYG